jgi:DNA adenine methylase
VSVPHPIPYQGSKRRIAHAIISYFPSNVERLIEPFAGSAAVSLAAASFGKVGRFILNDINAPLIDLWTEIVHRPKEIAEAYRQLWEEQAGREREFYNIVRQRFNQEHCPEDFLYLLARCVKAALRYNSNGEFNQSPDHRRKGMRPSKMESHILGASKLMQGSLTLFNGDYRDVLDFASPNDIVYMDPPYQGVCGNTDTRYIAGINYKAFVETLETLNTKGIAYIISYDGRTGMKKFGNLLPRDLGLKRIEIKTGKSSQATLLGQNHDTYESLYLSPALVGKTFGLSL